MSLSIGYGLKKTSGDELQHHGILGMRWGVRRFQNKDGTLTEAGRRRLGNGSEPIEDTILKAGARVSSVSPNSNSESYRTSAKRMYTYNPNDDWDRKVYTGPFSFYKRFYEGNKKIYEHQFETVKDLKMPTKKERVDEFLNLYKDEKIGPLMKTDLKTIQDYAKRVGMKGVEDIQNVDTNNVKSESDKRAAYELFNHAMEAADHFQSTRAYVDVMSKKYDAMVDDNNQGIYNNAHDPIIVFRTNEALKSIGNVRVVKDKEIRKNVNHIRSEQEKRGGVLRY